MESERKITNKLISSNSRILRGKSKGQSPGNLWKKQKESRVGKWNFSVRKEGLQGIRKVKEY